MGGIPDNPPEGTGKGTAGHRVEAQTFGAFTRPDAVGLSGGDGFVGAKGRAKTAGVAVGYEQSQGQTLPDRDHAPLDRFIPPPLGAWPIPLPSATLSR